MPASLQQDQTQKEEKRPDHPMHGDFQGRHDTKGLPVYGAQAPDNEGQPRINQAKTDSDRVLGVLAVIIVE